MNNIRRYFLITVCLSIIIISTFNIKDTYADTTTGLIASWKLEDTGTTTVAIDSSGNGRNGAIINGAQWVTTGRVGGALNFNGNNQYIQIPDYNIGQGVNAFSISMWFKPAVATSTLDRGLACYTSTGGVQTFCLTIARASGSGNIGFNVVNSNKVAVAASANSRFSSTAWNHVVGIYDGSNVKLYINNILQNSQPVQTGLTHDNAGKLRIVAGSGGNAFAGLIDEIKVYHRALSASDIDELFNPADTTAPSVPTDLSVSPISTTRLDLSWTASTDDIGVSKYFIYRDGLHVATSTTNSYSDIGLATSTTYVYAVSAIDFSGNMSSLSATTSGTTNSPASTDVIPPTVSITSPTERSALYGSVSISANVSDNVELAGVQFKIDGINSGAEIFSGPYSIIWNTASSTNSSHIITVVARDTSGLVSTSSSVMVTVSNEGLVSCSDEDVFSFGSFSDNYSGHDGGLRRVLSEMVSRDPNLRFISSNGDTPSYQRVRGVIDGEINDNVNCGAAVFPWFPAVGNHDFENQAYMDWWASVWSTDWETDPSSSPVALQLPGVSNFRKGPSSVLSHLAPTTTIAVAPGTIYSFDYKNVHMVFINAYEQQETEDIHDPSSGVWDVNGSDVFDPTNSQYDWLSEDLSLNTKKTTFVFSHTALKAPCYNYEPVHPIYPCPGPPPPGWSEHNVNYHTADLTKLLVDNNVTAYFFGHDHVQSRMLLDRDRNILYKKLYWDVANDPAHPYGSPSEWQNLQGAGGIWEIDTGRVYSGSGSFSMIKVKDDHIKFETYIYPSDDDGFAPAELWDTFTVPIDLESPTVPTELSANTISTSEIFLSWTASTDDVRMGGYKVWRDGLQIATTTATSTSYDDIGLNSGTTYHYTVSSFDAIGNESGQSGEAFATTIVSDTEAPSTPSNFSATVIGSSQINLSWNASTDNIQVSGYKIWRDGVQIATTTNILYNDAGLISSTAYVYSVSAFDAVGNNSMASANVYATTSQNPELPGIVASWKLDDSATTTAVDSSGNNYNGLLMNDPQWTVGKVGGGLGFDGINDYVEIGDKNIGQGVGAVTVSIWFKPNVATTTSDRGLLCNVGVSGIRTMCMYIARFTGSGKLVFSTINESGTSASATSNVKFSSNAWNHVLTVYDGSNVKMYLNGVLQSTQPAQTGLLKNNTGTLRMGYGPAGNTFQGTIDQVKVFHRVLSESEISQLFTQP